MTCVSCVWPWPLDRLVALTIEHVDDLFHALVIVAIVAFATSIVTTPVAMILLPITRGCDSHYSLPQGKTCVSTSSVVTKRFSVVVDIVFPPYCLF